MQTYEKAGLQFQAEELPDHLPVVLEFASTQPPEVAKEFLGEMAHILNALFTALVARNSPYASVLAAVLELAGERAEAVAVALTVSMPSSSASMMTSAVSSTRGGSCPANGWRSTAAAGSDCRPS